MMMHMPWVLVVMMLLLVILLAGALLGVRLLASRSARPDDDTRPSGA